MDQALLAALTHLLGPAVEAARRALVRLDDDDIPAPLRRVAADSSRQLPSPLARRVLIELDRSEWLREHARDAWAEIGGEDPAPDRTAAHLFLARPEGWEAELEAIGSSAAAATAEQELSSLRAQVEALTSELKATRAKLAEARRRPAQSPGRAVPARRSDDSAQLRKELEAADDQRRQLAIKLAEADAELAAMRARLRKATKARRSTSARSTVPSGWAHRTLEELATLLDELVASSTVEPLPTREPDPAGESSFRLPAGLSPDQAGAVDVLLQSQRSGVLLVDGYNVSFVLNGGSTPDRVVRDRLHVALSQFRREAKGPWRVRVVYDSEQGEGEEPAPRGLEVRYVGSADEALVEMAGHLGTRAVVVSSDRQVREESEAHGALGLWAEALAQWVTNR